MYFPRVYRTYLTINSLQIFVKTRTFEIFHFLPIDLSVIRFSIRGNDDCKRVTFQNLEISVLINSFGTRGDLRIETVDGFVKNQPKSSFYP